MLNPYPRKPWYMYILYDICINSVNVDHLASKKQPGSGHRNNLIGRGQNFRPILPFPILGNAGMTHSVPTAFITWWMQWVRNGSRLGYRGRPFPRVKKKKRDCHVMSLPRFRTIHYICANIRFTEALLKSYANKYFMPFYGCFLYKRLIPYICEIFSIYSFCVTSILAI